MYENKRNAWRFFACRCIQHMHGVAFELEGGVIIDATTK